MTKQGRQSEAIAWFQEASRQGHVEAELNLANALLREGQFEAAIDSYKKLISKNTTLSDRCVIGLVHGLVAMNEGRSALTFVEQYPSRNEEINETHIRLLALYARSNSDLALAERMVNRNSRSTTTATLETQAIVLNALGKHKEAMSIVSQLIKLATSTNNKEAELRWKEQLGAYKTHKTWNPFKL